MNLTVSPGDTTAQRLGLDSEDSAKIMSQRGGRVSPTRRRGLHASSQVAMPAVVVRE